MTAIASDRWRLRLAGFTSDVIGPSPALAALCAAGAKHSATWLAGIGWGALAMLFVGVMPYALTRASSATRPVLSAPEQTRALPPRNRSLPAHTRCR